MSNRKNLGSILIGTSIALGLFALAAAIVWWHQGMNVLIGSMVFILYGIGQWMTVLYWQRIQADWEATGETLGRLQQAVTDIPAALDANLKSIAQRLTEGQVQALAKLQGEVSQGAKSTLENGAKQIGDSLAKHLAAPLEAMKAMLDEQARRNEAHGERFSQLTESVGAESRKSVSEGAALVAGSLEANLKRPLAALEEKLAAWSRNADAQTEASRALGEENARSQREGSELARRLAESLSQEMKALAGAQAAQADRLLSAWSERAAAAQADAESKLTALQAALIEDVTSRLQAAEAGRGEAQERLLAKALSGVEGQARAAQEAVAGQVKALQAAAAEQTQALRAAAAGQIESIRAAFAERAVSAQAAADAQVQALSAAAGNFASGLAELKETSLGLLRDVEAKASSTLEAQSQLGLEVAGKVSELADRMRQGSQDVAELAHVAQINQTEMQAGVAMLNAGLASILDRLERQAAAGDGYQSLLAELGKTLSDFQERSAEVLMDNALKTQEILMEVLRGQEGGPSARETSLATAQ